MPPPSSFLIPAERDTPEERLAGRMSGDAILVGELDAHDDAVVFEDLAELTELDLFIEPGQVPGHGAGRS